MFHMHFPSLCRGATRVELNSNLVIPNLYTISMEMICLQSKLAPPISSYNQTRNTNTIWFRFSYKLTLKSLQIHLKRNLNLKLHVLHP